MTRDDEAFVHFQECLSNLNRAWHILGELRESDAPVVLRLAAYQMALVEYAKPFKKSRGSRNRRHALAFPLTADLDVKLHERVIDLRDQFLAHSDVSIKEAKVYLGELAGQPFPLIISNTDPSLPEPAAVTGLVERVLDALYAQIPTYKRQFQS